MPQTGLSRTSVFDICKRHEQAGAKALRDAPHGRKPGNGRLLDAKQEALIQKLIADKTPDQLKMPYALWTRATVAELIEHRLGIRLPVLTMGLCLARWGFTPQKPMKKAYEQSPAAVKRWLYEDYPVIAARAKAEGADIHWGDESGQRSDASILSPWGSARGTSRCSAPALIGRSWSNSAGGPKAKVGAPSAGLAATGPANPG